MIVAYLLPFVEEAPTIGREPPIPLYYKVETRLREAIEGGGFVPGERIPSENELARSYGVSRVTVREALRRIEEDGLISRAAGRGTFVLPQAAERFKIERNPASLVGFEEDIMRHGATPRVELLGYETSPVPDRMAALLCLTPGEEAPRAHRLGWADEVPLWVGSIYFHPRIEDAVAREAATRVSTLAYLRTVPSLDVTGTRVRISAAGASATQARSLEIRPGEPVLIYEFAYYSGDGLPISAGRSAYRSDRWAFTLESSSAPSVSLGTPGAPPDGTPRLAPGDAFWRSQ